MTTSAEIAQQVMNELDRGSFLWRPDRRPLSVRAKVHGVEYVVNRHGSELRFYRPGEAHRWLSIPIEIHADGQVTVSPDLGALYFSSLEADKVTRDNVIRAGELVRQVITALGYGTGRTSTKKLQQEIDEVLGSASTKTVKRRSK